MCISILGKVLMVVENRSVPTDARVWAEARALHRWGFQVCVISPQDATCGNATYACQHGIHLYYYRRPGYARSFLAYLFEYSLSMLQICWLSLRVLRRHGFDVIHAANPPDTLFFLHWLYFLLGKRFIFDQHDLSPEVFQVKFGKRYRFLLPLLRWLERRSYRVATYILTTNESLRKIAITRGQCDPARVFVVRNASQLERLKRGPANEELKRGRSHLLVYLGAMEIQDGIDYALRALHKLVYADGRQDVTLALLGDGGYQPELKGLVRELHLEKFVFFTGWAEQEEIVSYLSTADIGLCPEPLNGLNEYCTMLKTIDYMAMGLPIVAFDLAETHYTCQEAALYATPNAVSEFAQHIVRLLDEPALRSTMSKRARALIKERWNWDYAQQHLRRAYALLYPELSALNLPTMAVSDLAIYQA